MSCSFKYTGKQRCLRLKPVFSFEKVFQMSHLRNAALCCYRHLNTSDGVCFYQLGCVGFLTLSYIQGKCDLFLYLSRFSKTFIPSIIARFGPFIESETSPFSICFLSRLHANSVCFRITVISGKFCIATEQNNYIFMYVQWKWIHTAYIFMEQTFKTLTLDTKKKDIYILVCDR